MTDHFATPGKPTPEPFGYFKAEPFGWKDCAETDEGAKPLFDWDTVQDLLQQIEALEDGDALLRQALECLERSDTLGWQANLPVIQAIKERLK